MASTDEKKCPWCGKSFGRGVFALTQLNIHQSTCSENPRVKKKRDR